MYVNKSMVDIIFIVRLGGVLVVCGECYNLDRSVVVLFPHHSILFLKTPKVQGISSLAL